MSDDKKNLPPVCVLVAKTPAEAAVVVGLLRGAGIPATVEGSSLADELAVSRRMLNLVGTHVLVPASSEYLAREVIAAGREAGSQPHFDEEALDAAAAPAVEQPAPAPALQPPARRGGTLAWAIVATIAAIGFAWEWLDTRAQIRELAGGGGGVLMEWSGDWLEVRDANDRRLISRNLDSDRNGRYECVEEYGHGGTLETRSHDSDQNGLYERVEEFRRNGMRVEWEDLDADGFMDRGRWHDQGGKLLRAQREAAEGGYVDEPR
jgi:hypothetical protein